MDAGGGRRHLSKNALRRVARAWAIACVLALGVTSGSGGAASPGTAAKSRTIDYWIAAVPVVWNVAPNGRDGITGMPIAREDAIIPTVVYRRYSTELGQAARERSAR